MGRDHREWQKVFSRALRAQGNLLRRMVQARRAKFREQRRLRVPLPAGTEEGRAALRRQLCAGELYIAWNVTSPDAQGQTVFRLLQGALEGAEPNRLLAVEKAAGHRGWGKETVYVFGRDAADAFLDVVIAENEAEKRD